MNSKSNARYVIEPWWIHLGVYQTVCSLNINWSHLLREYYILDIDECDLGPCDKECHNTMGSFECLCPTGFTTNNENNRRCGEWEYKIGIVSDISGFKYLKMFLYLATHN